MTFIINRTRTHQQSLLDLVNFANDDTIDTPLTVANTGITKRGELYPGVYGLRLTNLSRDNDTVDVQHTKIQLGDVLLFSKADLSWFNPLNVPPSNRVWDNAAQVMVENAIAKMGFNINKIFNPPNACFVTYNTDESGWFITFRCDSFVFEEVFHYRLPHYFGEFVKSKDLSGFQFNPVGSTEPPITDAYPVVFTKTPWELLIGLVNFENGFTFDKTQFAWKDLSVLSTPSVKGGNTGIALDLLAEPSEVIDDWVTFTYKRMALSGVWPKTPVLTPGEVGLNRNDRTIDIPTLIATLADRLYLDQTDYGFVFDYLKRRVTITALATNVAYTGSVQFTIAIPIGLAELVTVTKLDGFKKDKFY